MSLIGVQSFACGRWVDPGAGAVVIADAATGAPVARVGNAALDTGAMRDYARMTGGPALRQMTFHDRARMLKSLALHLDQHRDALYELSYHTGATLADSRIDIDGGIATVFVIASKGRREMPDDHVYLDGPPEALSRGGSFMGQHVATPLRGVALHINAFNFPVWGMLEKLAPALLAGMPVIVKPASTTSYVTEACVRLMIQSDILPSGAVQLIAGGVGDLMSRLDCQDVVSFTGSAATARHLRSADQLIGASVRFIAEQDSLNASVLGPDAGPGTPEFDLFIREVHRELTVKAGQKCTAIRRIIVPDAHVGPVIAALEAEIAKTRIGAPKLATTGMGALVSSAQKQDVLDGLALLEKEAPRVIGDPARFELDGADPARGAFLPPMVLCCDDPDAARQVHETELFGPVSTVMGYRDTKHAIDLVNRGGGSLVASLITGDPDMAKEVVMGAGAYHGRIYINNRDSMAEATGHGAPLPHMIHGGPGRAGGGEELGGIRGVMHYMQRTAIQGSPDMLSGVGRRWVPGASEITKADHPFTRRFDQLEIGETLHTATREVTSKDIETFAAFTGDRFYAHMDDAAARRNPFFPGRVAHGYLLLSFAAGLFVQPDEGPVLANTGLANLRFLKPVEPGSQLRVRLAVMQKTPRNDEYGEVRWHVTIRDQVDEAVAEYELLTMNAR